MPSAPIIRPANVQIHYLTAYTAALPNRDDTGMNKVMTYGGAVRTRISSQAQKRRWRQADDRYAIANIANVTPSYRSREIIDLMVMKPLYEAKIATLEVLDNIGSVFNTNIYSLGADDRKHRQAMLLGQGEVRYLAEHARKIAEAHPQDAKAAAAAAQGLFSEKGEGDNFKVFRYNTRMAAGIEAALFGRMVTSDPKANIDGAIHVAHAFTVHEAEHDTEYFTTVDDLHTMTNDPGTSMLGHTEITSGIYYGYVVADIKNLVANTEGRPASEWMSGERTMAAQITHNLIQLIATIPTAAKMGSTAAHSDTDFMMVEIGEAQPRTLAGAYRWPAQPTLADALEKLTTHLDRKDRMIRRNRARRHSAIIDWNLPGSIQLGSVDELASWVQEAICNGAAR